MSMASSVSRRGASAYSPSVPDGPFEEAVFDPGACPGNVAKASGLQVWQHSQLLKREHAISANEVRGERIAGEGVAVDHQDVMATPAQLQRETGSGHTRANDHNIVR